MHACTNSTLYISACARTPCRRIGDIGKRGLIGKAIWLVAASALFLFESQHLVAVLLINPTASAMKFDVPLNVLPLAGSGANLTAAAVKSRDIWQHAAGPSIACPGPACAVQTTVPAMDSVFLRLYH